MFLIRPVFCLPLILFLFGHSTHAKFKTPALRGPVMDEVGVLSPQHAQDLEQRLRIVNQQGIAQIQVYITSSLQNLTIEEASIDISDQWKLGTKTKDNGLLYLIAPNERKVRIEVGQGLEGILPDVYAKRINEDIVVPYFKRNQMSEGIYQGVLAVIGVLGGNTENLPPTSSSTYQENDDSIPMWILIPFILIFIFGGFGRRRRGYSNFGWGGGGFGGGSGGGWSGGGGGFSGGGSSSSW